jgi:hypothetical protein
VVGGVPARMLREVGQVQGEKRERIVYMGGGR